MEKFMVRTHEISECRIVVSHKIIDNCPPIG